MSKPDAARVSVRLSRIRLEADGVASYEFRPVEAVELPAFAAGAHIDLLLPENRVRSYSLVNDPAELHRYVIAVQRDDHGRGEGVRGLGRIGRLINVMAVKAKTGFEAQAVAGAQADRQHIGIGQQRAGERLGILGCD